MSLLQFLSADTWQPCSAIGYRLILFLPSCRLAVSPSRRLRPCEIPVRRVPEERSPGTRPEAADVGARGRECLFPVEEDDRNFFQQQILDLAVDVLSLGEIEG